MVKKMVAEGRVVLRDKAFFMNFGRIIWMSPSGFIIRVKKENTRNLFDSTPIT